MLIALAMPAWSDQPDGAGPAEEGSRPDWIIGNWKSGQHSMTLDPDGSLALVFLATLSGQTDKWLGRASGAGTWSLAPAPEEPGWFVLQGLKQPYALRSGQGSNKLLVRDPLTGGEVPFFRVDEASAELVSEALSLLGDIEGGKVRGGERIDAAARALGIARALPEPSPMLVADASFWVARALDEAQRRQEAMAFYDAAIDLREQVYESPHVDLTRACFFAGRCAEQVAGNGKALWYLSRATMNQHAVLERLEGRADAHPDLVRAARAETAAVYVQTADFLGNFGYTEGVVELYPAAIRSASAAGNGALARAATVKLFNHLMARPTLHDHSRLLFWAHGRIEAAEARDRVVRRRVSGRILGEARVARELAEMSPPHPELAERTALRTIALSRMAGEIQPAYVQAQVVPKLIADLGLSDRVEDLPAPDAGLWPANQPSIDRGMLDQVLDAVSPPVDLAEAFPEWDLNADQPPSLDPHLQNTLAGLADMLPRLLGMAKRLSPQEREAEIDRWLASLKGAAAETTP